MNTLRDAPLVRVSVEADADNGLGTRSQVMIDKLQTVRREKLGYAFGRLSDRDMVSINRALAVFLGIA